jgi:5-methylcytosine-specific restriction endonuclease McrA
MSERIHLEDKTDWWKWVYPNGHRNWEPTNHHFWCETCASNYDADGEFDELRNKATGEVHDRDQLKLLTPGGPYPDLRHEPEGSA